MGTLHFHWADYLVFGTSLLLSVSVGVFYGWRDRNKKSVEEFLMAGRNMPVVPVSLSLFVSWISAIAFLGDPVEVYYHGVVYILLGVGYAACLPFVAYLFAPVFYRMKVTSAYEACVRSLYSHTMLLSGMCQIVILTYNASIRHVSDCYTHTMLLSGMCQIVILTYNASIRHVSDRYTQIQCFYQACRARN